MAYENAVSFATPASPKIAEPRAIPESPSVLQSLAEASAIYAKAADVFISARHDLNDAKMNWQAARDAFAKASEAEGI